jgi:hypothetical protein
MATTGKGARPLNVTAHALDADGCDQREHLSRARVERIVQSRASGENPAPAAPGSRRGNPAESAHAHHINWDARVIAVDAIATD